MNKILIVVGNKEKTSLFSVNKAVSEMVKLEDIENPDAKKRERDLVSDSSGRIAKDNGLGSRKLGSGGGALEHSLDLYVGNILNHVQNIQLVAVPPKN